MMTTSTIRNQFVELFKNGEFAENDTLEILNASFIADEKTIFGKLDEVYAQRELSWYLSKSLSIDDMKGQIPKIWEEVASKNRMVNSNYGWCIFSKENFEQFNKCVRTLIRDKHSRQAVMIYIRPTMHEDAFVDGMKDFMCTFAAQVFIRGDELHYMVYMRSNDAIFGYKNDKFWHDYVHFYIQHNLRKYYPRLRIGKMYWNAGSLHIYPRHYHLIGEVGQ